MQLFEIDGKSFVINMTRLIKFVTDVSTNEKNNGQLITQIWSTTGDHDNTLELASKEIQENKSNFNEVTCNIRYDFVRNLLSYLMDVIHNQITGMPVIIESVSDMTFGQRLAFNTLINEGIIEEK